MASLQYKYTKELYQEFGYLATWLPGLKIALGDVGYLVKNQFTKVTSLSQLGIPFSTNKMHNPIILDYASKDGISIHLKNKGEFSISNSALLKADAGLTIQFLKENALIFKSDNALISTINENRQLGKTVIERYKANEWQRDWVVITEVVNTSLTSILMSNSANGKIELKGEIESTDFSVPLLSNELSVVHHSNISLRIIGESGLTPLFKSMRIKGFTPFKTSFREATSIGTEFKQISHDTIDFVTNEFEEE